MPRVRKSDAMKAKLGTLQPCRSNSTSKAVVSNLKLTAKPPVGLTKDARNAWKLAIQSAPEGVLTALDGSVLERWARNYALCRKLSSEVEADGAVLHYTDDEGQERSCENPAFKALIKVQQQLSLCEKELGFTPASRSRVQAVEDEDDSDNEFSEF